MFAWKPFFLVLVLSGPPAAAFGAGNVDYRGPQAGNFELRLYAPFLEPGEQEAARAGQEVRVDDFRLTGQKGFIKFRIWGVDGGARFSTSVDATALVALITELDGGAESTPLRVWRHRHGYTRDNRGRYWWNTLGESPEPLEPRLGALYDRFLRGVWRLWVARAVRARLAGTASPDFQGGPERLVQSIQLTYDATGLVGTFPEEMALRLWGVPLQLHFTIAPALPTEDNPWILGLTDVIALGYSRQEWRRRHGYHLGFWGDNVWDDDFPAPAPDLQVSGALLESLLKRTLRFWADSSVNIALSGLDEDLKASIGSLKKTD